MQTRFEWFAKQSIYKHLGSFSIHTLSSCHSEFELDTTAAVRSKHKCILQLPPPTKNARWNLPIFHPHPRPCCSQLVFLVEKEKSKESWSSASSPLLIGQKGFQKHELNKTHPGVHLHSLKFILVFPQIILGSNMYPITRSNMSLLHLCN